MSKGHSLFTLLIYLLWQKMVVKFWSHGHRLHTSSEIPWILLKSVFDSSVIHKYTYNAILVWWAAVYGVAQSRTRLKWLSSSSSSITAYFSLILKPKSIYSVMFTAKCIDCSQSCTERKMLHISTLGKYRMKINELNFYLFKIKKHNIPIRNLKKNMK